MALLFLLLVCSVFPINFVTEYYAQTGCGGDPWGYSTLNRYSLVLDRYPSSTDWSYPELDCIGYVFGSTAMSTRWECTEEGLQYRVYNTSSCTGGYSLIDLTETGYDLTCYNINDYFSYKFACIGPQIDDSYAHVLEFDETVTTCSDDDPTLVTGNVYYVVNTCFQLSFSASFKYVSETGYDLSIQVWGNGYCTGLPTVEEEWFSTGCVTGRRSYGSKRFAGFGEEDVDCTNANEDGYDCPDEDDDVDDDVDDDLTDGVGGMIVSWLML